MFLSIKLAQPASIGTSSLILYPWANLHGEFDFKRHVANDHDFYLNKILALQVVLNNAAVNNKKVANDVIA